MSRDNCETPAIRAEWPRTRHLSTNPLCRNGDTRPRGSPRPCQVRKLPHRRTGIALRIKAEYLNGTLIPLEPLELEEGTVVTRAIEQEEPAGARQHSVVETIDRLRKDADEDEWDGVPTDGARNYRHYLYGHPKADQE